jgi:hypothetical protein
MIIGFSGKAGSGKDTCADFVADNYLAVEQMKVAGILKEMLAVAGLPEPADRAEKEAIIPGLGFSWRTAAQTLGTEWGRGLNQNLWLILLGAKIKRAQELGKHVVISDIRMENEAKLVRELGGIVIQLEGRYSATGAAGSQASEVPLPDNSGSYVSLQTQLTTILDPLLKA